MDRYFRSYCLVYIKPNSNCFMFRENLNILQLKKLVEEREEERRRKGQVGEGINKVNNLVGLGLGV